MIKPKAVVYIRVSDKSQIENNSLETQERACLNFIKSRGYELAREPFRDEGFSAKQIDTRPSLKELISYCVNKKNEIKYVVIYKYDRWARNTQDGLYAEALLSKYGVELVSVSENTSKDPTGTFMKTIFLGAAQWDNEMKGLRVVDNLKTMFNDGRWCWKPPIGYKRPSGSKEEKRGMVCEIDNNLGPIVKTIFLEASRGTKKKVELAKIANALGFSKYNGKEADCNLISKIVKKTFYYGYMYAPKWKTYAWGKHEPIIDEDTWRKANTNLFGKRSVYQFQDLEIYPLKGTIKCGTCGHPFTSSNPRGKFRYYECKQKNCIKQQRLLVDRAEKQFIALLKSIKPNEYVMKLFNHAVFTEWDKEIEFQKQKIKKYEDEIKKLDELISSYSISENKGILTSEEARIRIDTARNKICVLRIEMGDTKVEQYNGEITKNFTEIFLSNLDNLWIRLNLTKKQLLQNKIFPNGIQCQNMEIRTDTLSPSFQYIQRLTLQNSPLVTPQGIGPWLAE